MSTAVSLEKVRNIGISAHIDSGKTTLTERILFYTGRIHQIHEVRGKDGVGAKMDSMDLEREKGITIQSAATYCTWNTRNEQYNINIIDTPGHVDFTIEVERALRVLDGAILVLCSVSGVQSQSLTVDRQMTRYKVPRIAFINKMDRAGANAIRVRDQLREKLRHNAHMIAMPIGAEDKFEGVIDLVAMEANYYEGDDGNDVVKKPIPAELLDEAKQLRNELCEAMGDFDDNIAEKFLEEKEITPEELRKAVRKATLSLKFVPVMCGSAYKNKGVQLLLDAVCSYLPNPTEVENTGLDQADGEKHIVIPSDPEKPFVGLAFKLEDGRYGQLTYIRIYQGTLRKGDTIYNINAGERKVKVPRLVRMHSNEMHDIESARSGDICAMFGVECASGDTFTDGTVKYTMSSMHIPDAVISLAVQPKDKANSASFSKALNRFTKEDPTFRVHRDEESAQTIISGMGELHLEIYVERMKREYQTEVITGKPQVAYRETITQKVDYAYTHKKQTGGSGQYAKIAGYFEPLPQDAVNKFEFVDEVVGGSVPREFISAVEKGFTEAVAKGTLIGFPVVGVRVVLNDGGAHAVDSSELAFKIAAIYAFRDFYEKAKPGVLEPIMRVQVSVPEEYQGTIIGQVNQRRGVIRGSDTNEGYTVVDSDIPLSEMFGYSTDLRSATQGKGEYTMEFAHYAQAPRQEQERLVAEYKKKKEAEKK